MRRRTLPGALLVLALLAAAGVAPGAASGAPGRAAPASSEDRLMKATALAQDAWRVAHGDSRYAGHWVDPDGRVHVSYQGRAAAAASAAAVRSISGDVVVHEGARYTYRELVDRRDKVSDHVAALRQAGIRLVEWGPHESTNTLRLGVVDPSEATVRTLRDRFGADIEIEEVPEPEKDALFLSRWDDFSPWSAGAELNDGYSSCTIGPGIRRNGVNYFLTAAHCFANGAYLYNGSEYVGRKNWIDTRDRGTDTAIVTGTGSATMFRTDTTLQAMSATPWTSAEGSGVCFNGAYSGEVCGGLTVIKTNYCTDITGRLTCGTATAGKDGVAAAGHGDSGGPVHIVSPRWAYAGTIVGAASPQFVCPRNNQGGTRTCSSWVRFQMIGPVLSYWNATLL
ncbi:hypothetical protein ACIBXA_22690 [Micromonospora echinaurantiaca]|jgi:hypothetical protein|uniref:hypothetical protein n=1 Tax=Micromonospora echinaurantiaca TaxID=47857 RepID=UPI00379A2910